MTEPLYSIGELAAAAGTTPRTIRYYTAEGLLLPPTLRGRYGQYRREHLLRLRAIARLKQSFLPLPIIRARLEGLSEAALEQLLAAEDAATNADQSPAHRAEPRSAPGRIAETSQRYVVANASPHAYGFVAPSSTAEQHGTHGFIQPAAPSFMPYPALEAGETWQRLSVAPGIELHVREPASAEERAKIERLLAVAKQLFP